MLVEGGSEEFELVVASGMQGVDAAQVVGFTTKVYTTKTGETVPTMVSQCTDRSNPEDSFLVDVLLECVQRTGVKAGDELFTAYRQCASGKKGGSRLTRRVLQRKEVADGIKDGSEGAGLPRENFSAHSLLKTHATSKASGGSGAVDLNRAAGSKSRADHYDFSNAVGSGSSARPKRLKKNQLQALLPATRKQGG